jgi:hypothetical protein
MIASVMFGLALTIVTAAQPAAPAQAVSVGAWTC